MVRNESEGNQTVSSMNAGTFVDFTVVFQALSPSSSVVTFITFCRAAPGKDIAVAFNKSVNYKAYKSLFGLGSVLHFGQVKLNTFGWCSNNLSYRQHYCEDN